ncbi:MAG TPA: hypothetical protein ACFE0H_14255 [Elainellaceae cyanobacterium]
MAEIQISVEGQAAIAATQDLLAIDGLSGQYEVDEEDVEREGILATIATIVAIVGGTMAIAEQLYQWRQRYKSISQDADQGTAQKVDQVLIVCGDRRILLENATVEEIKAFLDGCQS